MRKAAKNIDSRSFSGPKQTRRHKQGEAFSGVGGSAVVIENGFDMEVARSMGVIKNGLTDVTLADNGRDARKVRYRAFRVQVAAERKARVELCW